MIRRSLCAALAALMLSASPAAAQRRPVVQQFPLALVDLSIVWDTASGVQLLAAPSLATRDP
jgi:hypothetical protein